MNSSTTFVAAWILSSETMAEATLDAESQTGASSIVGLMTNLSARMARRHFFRGIQVMFTPSRWSHPCLAEKCSVVDLACTFSRSLTNRKVCSMVAERFSCQHTPVTTADVLWHRVKAAWASAPIDVIQSLFYSMPKRISVVIIARSGH
ncbi:hypothetical protein TNCV_5040261 [Trichonephila clavipes]|nr:hypothetical protein TNCV_5040261 [Trichonephila clavipes]